MQHIRAWRDLIINTGKDALRRVNEQTRSLSSRNIWLLIGMIAVLTFANALVFMMNTQTLVKRQQSVLHSQTVMTDLNALLVALDDAETGQRGYLLTNKDPYLRVYQQAPPVIKQEMAQLQSLTKDNAGQQQRLATLQPIIAAKLAELQQTVALNQAGDGPAALQIVQSDAGEQAMMRIRQLVQAMQAEESRLLQQRTTEADRALGQAITTFVLAFLLIAALLVGLGFALQRSLHTRERLVSEQQELLEQEQAARHAAETAVQTRDHFLSLASHEMKTPITAFYASTQILQRRLANGREISPKILDTMERQSRRLRLLIDGLLDVTRIETGHFSLDCQPLDINMQVRHIVEELEPLATQQTLRVSGPAAALIITGDAVRLEEVWYNIIQNAIKYSPDGGDIDIVIEPRAAEVCVMISDHGLGIAAAALPHLFERFYRSEQSNTRHISGIGIGLFVTHEIVVQHGGTITVTSKEGHGSTFTICLPRGPQREEVPVLQAATSGHAHRNSQERGQ